MCVMRAAGVVVLSLSMLSAGAGELQLVKRGDAELAAVSGEPGIAVAIRIETSSADAAGDVTIRSRRTGAAASIGITAAELAKLRRMVVPPGLYDLSFHLDRHRYLVVTILVDAKHPDVPPLIRIPAAPLVSGVVRAAGVPLEGARVVPLPAGRDVTTDAQGRFTIEVDGAWPEELRISHRGHGTVYAGVPGTAANAELPPVELQRAALVRVSLPRILPHTVAVELTLPSADGAEPRVVAAKRIAAGRRDVAFDDVAPGMYVVVARGSEPLACAGARVGVAAGERRTVDMALPIAFVHGRVTRGGSPFAGARVTMQHDESGWITTFHTDGDGAFASAVWEPGSFELAVRDDPAHAPFIGHVTIARNAPLTRLAIDVPGRRVKGRVLDASGSPVATAVVTLRSHSAERVPTIRARTGPNGEFEYTAVHAGDQTLRVLMPGYLRPDPIVFRLEEKDTLKEVEVRLHRGASRSVSVADLKGGSIAGALIIGAADGNVRSLAYTDTHGRADVAMRADETTIVYVFPAEGSFAIRRIPERAPHDEPLRIVVPPGTASLEVVTRTVEGAPLPDIALLMRYNGESIPPEVAREMRTHQGNALNTGEDGAVTLRHIPPGAYELWPYRTDEEAAGILAAAFEAPINVNVLTGANRATVRFRSLR